MIINTSRAQQWQSCRVKAFNWDELKLMSFREADPLMIGEAYHLGSEIITKNANVDEAVKSSEARFRKRLVGQVILPEEKPDIERNIEFVKHAVAAWADHYNQADFRVLWPEVSGNIALPNTLHHCYYCHRLLHPDVPFNSCEAQYNGERFGKDSGCMQPHYFRFRTDGVIEMYRKVWLLEQKTTSSTERNNFWGRWQMEFQTRGYCYGVWKATGVLVSGFLLNAIIKHSKQVTVEGRKRYHLDPTNVDFEREPFLVTQSDLEDWEREMILIANEYERSFRDGIIYKNTKSCFDYNRQCYYLDLCKRGGEQLEGEFRQRKGDYVEKSYYQMLGLPLPEGMFEKEEEEEECTNPVEPEKTTNSTPTS